MADNSSIGNQPAQFWSLQHKVTVAPTVSLSISKFHQGIDYVAYLKQIHEVRQPASYLEIGVRWGTTLALARCPAVAIDPNFQLQGNPIGTRDETYLFQQTSDEFFSQRSLKHFLPDGVDFAFLDGMHQFEFLLRDFMNTEKYSHGDTVVALHDCYPVNVEIAEREWNPDRRIDLATREWWAGDVWKLLPILRDFRPDLDVAILDCPPTGLVVVRGLDPQSKTLADAYADIVANYRNTTLEAYTIERFRNEFATTDSRRVVEPAALTNFLTAHRKDRIGL